MVTAFTAHEGIQLACSMRGLAAHPLAPAAQARELIEWIASAGARSLILDAVHPELRARDLGRSARRDLAATIRRAELAWQGIDAFVPAAHLAAAETSDRALSAVLGAIELAGELRAMGLCESPVVALDLPDDPQPGVVSAIAAAAERLGVVAACPKEGHAGLSRTIDLDALAEVGADVVVPLSARSTAQVRWGGPRIERRVDLLSVTGALAVRGTPCGIALDLSKSADPTQALPAALSAWTRVNPVL